jgi:tRNA pseudouridine55 synthase
MRAGLSCSIDGVLLLDKPSGITSNAAIQRVKRLLQARKVGHVGTLDPLASGLLPICLGEATKFSGVALSADKRYEADILLGTTTSTGDTEGEITAQQPVRADVDEVEAVLKRYTGTIEQIPPMYSALKHAGRPLYAYARAGQTIARQPRRITIHELAFIEYANARLRVDVRCSKGTYIRVLAEDIGKALGCGATLAGLRRTAVGNCDLTRAVTLKEMERQDDAGRRANVLPVDTLVSSLPRMQLEAQQQQRILTGRTAPHVGPELAGLVRLYSHEDGFLGLGDAVRGVLVPRRLVAVGKGL